MAFLAAESTWWGVKDFRFNRQHPAVHVQGRDISGENSVGWGVEKDMGLSRNGGGIFKAEGGDSDLDHLPVRSQGCLQGLSQRPFPAVFVVIIEILVSKVNVLHEKALDVNVHRENIETKKKQKKIYAGEGGLRAVAFVLADGGMEGGTNKW